VLIGEIDDLKHVGDYGSFGVALSEHDYWNAERNSNCH